MKKIINSLVVGLLLVVCAYQPVQAAEENYFNEISEVFYEEDVEEFETLNALPPKQNYVRTESKYVGTHAYVVNQIGSYYYGGWVPLVGTTPFGKCIYRGLAPLLGPAY